jgi:acetoacetyl-CoA synthetase
MGHITEGTLLWQPTEQDRQNANLTDYMTWLSREFDVSFDNYAALWQWSVENAAEFWQSIWLYFEVISSKEATTPLASPAMPDAKWFEGAELNYAENFFARKVAGQAAILFKAEDRPLIEITWDEIAQQTAQLASALRMMGVAKGDRVVAYMPHIPETIVALFAVSSLGAIWSGCSPDFGSRSVLDRFQQIEPKVLLTVDSYQYGGKTFDRREIISELNIGLPTLEKIIVVSDIVGEEEQAENNKFVAWSDLVYDSDESQELTFEQVSFDHPLWVLYSSGTTGLPKPIVQGHGGILLEHLKMSSLHLDLKPGDRFFWYTSTGWMMWNFLIGGLLAGATIVIYDGSPGYPNLNVLWELAQKVGITYFGTSAAFIGVCVKANLTPGESYDLRRLRAVGSTGSPLSPEGFAWIYKNVHPNIALESVSGGTDLCTAFLGGCRLLPIYAGEIQGAALGADVKAFNESGESVVDEMGELVITRPMPSMPLFFWNDPGDERYRASYFEMYPGIWRHGDWIKFNERGGCVIYGRSDSTINRQGIRMGTSELYRTVESLPEVQDSLVIDLELLGREPYLYLFIVLKEDRELDDALKSKIKQSIRTEISPRHLPNEIAVISEVPYTLSGKKMEVPVRRVLLGSPVEVAVNVGAMRNPKAIDYFVELAESVAIDD